MGKKTDKFEPAPQMDSTNTFGPAVHWVGYLLAQAAVEQSVQEDTENVPASPAPVVALLVQLQPQVLLAEATATNKRATRTMQKTFMMI